ncbi:hypothetical protein BJV78DRAFT_1183349 [Lactifluus subvellereus]|nr:hypothetical protein BJV78DRAFT_1183349 [Lactifluus subvellereus]
MGSASSTQRGGKATQSQTILRESTNANTPKDIAQAANTAKDTLITSNTEHDPKKGNATPSDSTAPLVTALSSKTYVGTTDLAVIYPEDAASILPSPLGSVPGVRSPELTNAITLSQTPTTLEVVTSQDAEDAPNRNLTGNQEREVLKLANIKDPKIHPHPQKKSRRGRGRGRSKAPEARIQEDGENLPPPTARENKPPHRGRAPHRGSGQVETGARPASRRGRPTNRMGGTGGRRPTSRPDELEGVTEVDGMRNHGRSRSRVNAGVRRGRAPGHMTPHARFDDPGILGSDRGVVPAIVENIEMPKTDKANLSKTGNWTFAEGNLRKSVPAPIPPSALGNATASPPDEETAKSPAESPVSTSEGDVSTVQPLPSSTRRRAKEYFQRRTRERSVDVDATRRHTKSSPRGASVTEQGIGIQSNVQVPRPQLDLKEAVAKGSEKPGKGKDDQFTFDPEASPFTPNATSSPRQASLSSIGVQSYSSPTPLPSHGNRRVAPLVLAKASNRNTSSEIQSHSVSPLIPGLVTSGVNQGTHEFTYAYSGANQAQAHLEAEQLAFMRLQAYYTWLGGRVPASGVAGAREHLDMSGGGGGLGGGVALGRQVQSRIRGKTQFRNANGAYAHPKEHVVFSPRDHERMEVASPFVPQGDSGQTGLVKPGKDDTDEKLKLEGEARRPTQKWDGKWGLREVSASSKEVGWNWGG